MDVKPGNGSVKSYLPPPPPTPTPIYTCLLLIFPSSARLRFPECRLSEEQILPAGGWGEQASRPCSCWAQGKGWLGSWQLAERTWSALLCLQPLDSLIDDPRRPGLLTGQQPHLRGSCQVNLPALPPFLLRLPAPHPCLLKCCDIAPLCPPFLRLCDPGTEHSCAG